MGDELVPEASDLGLFSEGVGFRTELEGPPAAMGVSASGPGKPHGFGMGPDPCSSTH